MPLTPDGLNRGAHATHVCWHPKLEKHRTVINGALEIVNRLIDDRLVTKVLLGRIFLPDLNPFPTRVQAKADGKRIEMTVFAPDAAQIIHATTRSNGYAQRVADSIRR